MLTPDTELRLHLAQARAYWQADRLDLALAAIKRALRLGVDAGGWYDLQRMIEAEWGARSVGRRVRVGEGLELESVPGADPRDGARTQSILERALADVGAWMGIRWAKPVLVTLIPHEEWVEFMHARYGYYAERAERHKVCLPPSAVHPPVRLGMAARHEMAHAAVAHRAGDDVPGWLNEGIAVLCERGFVPSGELTHLRNQWNAPLPSLSDVSAGFTDRRGDISELRTRLSYAAAEDFVGRLVRNHGITPLLRLLDLLGTDRPVERAFRDAFGLPLRQVEKEWRAAQERA